MKTKQVKRKEAEERNKERAKRSPKQQLKRLDDLLGRNKGAEKERRKLWKKIKSNK